MACVDELDVNRALKGRTAAIPVSSEVHHYSHWRFEEYLRRRVPLLRVRSHLLNENVDQGVPSRCDLKAAQG